MFKKVIIIIAFAVCLIIGGLLMVDAEQYAGLITDPVQRMARDAGINLAFEHPRLTLRSFTAPHAGLSFPVGHFPVLIAIDQLEIRPHWLQVLLLRPAFDISGTLYKGTFNGVVAFEDFSGNGNCRISLQGMELGGHPQINSLGLSGGILSVESDSISFSGRGIGGGSLRIALENLEMRQAARIPPALSGAPLDIPVPAFYRTTLRLQSSVKSPRLTDFEVKLSSSLGEATGKGTLAGSDNTPQQLAFDLQASLTSAGKEGIGPYLTLASNGKLETSTERFSAVAKGPLQRLFWDFKRLR